MKLSVLIFLLFTLNLYAQVEKYDEGTIYLRNGDSLVGDIKLNSFSTEIVYKNLDTKKKKKLGARDIDYIRINNAGKSHITFKLIDGKGGEPKIVQQIIKGRINLFKRLEKGNPTGQLHNTHSAGYYNPNHPLWNTTTNSPTETIVKSNAFSNNNDIVLKQTYSNSTGMSQAQGVADFFSLIAILEGESWMYSEGTSDLVKMMPKKRNDIMKLFNDCPQAMAKFRDVKDKDFDFVYFLNFYNVECAAE